MATPRQEGGIGGRGGSNVNPIYRPFKAVGEAINRYMATSSKEYNDAKVAEEKYGWDSPQAVSERKQYRGAALQGRRYNSKGQQVK